MFSLRSTFKDLRIIVSNSVTRNYGLAKPKVICGQPTPETHPHLLKGDEVLPSIQKNEFMQRRTNLIDLIKRHMVETKHDIKAHVVVIPSAVKKYMSEKIPYVFRQNSDFLYLTGCLEPDCCLVLTSVQDSGNYTAALFVRNPDSQSEIWDGPRTSTETATQLFGVDVALPTSELKNYIQSYLESHDKHVVWYDYLDQIQPSINKSMEEFLKMKPKYCTPKPFVHKLRLIKSPAEIALMSKSCEIASDAFVETITKCYPGITEHEIFAKIDYYCRMRGAEYLAYPPVVAGGDRATIIHYVHNNQKVKNKEMVLMDAGCEYHGYSSDITRTWPINGKFNAQQRELYEIIYTVQQELINKLNMLPPLDDLFDQMIRQLGKYLQEVGLINKSLSEENLFKEAYKFCPHHVSHYLGMDVHDTAVCPRDIPLEPGMVITVEPGVYMNKNFSIPKEYKGLGIRIEDDILITSNGPKILTKNVPRDLKSIEEIASRRRDEEEDDDDD